MKLGGAIKLIKKAIDDSYENKRYGQTAAERGAWREKARTVLAELEGIKAHQDLHRLMYNMSRLLGFPKEIEAIRTASAIESSVAFSKSNR